MASNLRVAFLVVCSCALLIAAVNAAGSPMWQLSQGDIGQGLVSFLVSKDGSTIWALWSLNAWAPYPSIFLLSLEATTGHMRWNGTLFGRQQTNQQYTISEGSDVVYVGSVFGGNVTSLLKSNGAVQWNVAAFQGVYNPGSMAGVTESGNYVIVAATVTSVALHRASGAVDAAFHAPASSKAPIVVTNGTGAIVGIYGSYQVSAALRNGTESVTLWTVPSVSLLDADADYTLVSASAGVGVPQLSVLNTNSGDFVTNFTLFNTQNGFLWGALFRQEQLAVGYIAPTFMAMRINDGSLLWQQNVLNASGLPIRFNATHIAIPTNVGSAVVALLYRAADGAITGSVEVAASFDEWSQTLQLSGSSVSNIAVVSITTSASPYYSNLYVASLGKAAVVGIVVHHFPKSLNCEGAYHVSVVPTGCTLESSGASVERSCTTSGNGISVATYGTSADCQGTASSTTTYASGSCYQNIESSFKVNSCS